MPRSHAFVERLMGTIRREYLDRIWFWNQSELERKLENYKVFYNQYRCHTGLAGLTPAQTSGGPSPPTAHLDSHRWQQHCRGSFQPQLLPELEFATDRRRRLVRNGPARATIPADAARVWRWPRCRRRSAPPA